MEYLDKFYTYEEVADMLRRAEKLGFSLEAGSELEKMTVGELDVLVSVVQ